MCRAITLQWDQESGEWKQTIFTRRNISLLLRGAMSFMRSTINMSLLWSEENSESFKFVVSGRDGRNGRPMHRGTRLAILSPVSD